MALELQRRPITVDDYHRMAEAGIFGADERVELLHGQIIAMPPMGAPHLAAMNRLNRLLTRRFDERVYVQVQCPVVVGDDSEPQPDFALLSSREAALGGRRLPESADAFAVIEVAESSRLTDRRIKAPLYAATGIPEYWIVDLVDNIVVVYREPSPEGYRSTFVAHPGDEITFAAFPDTPLSISQLLADTEA